MSRVAEMERMKKMEWMKKMGEITHHTIKTNGISMHVAEKGQGPVVLLLHGFPQLWFSWHHQIGYLANHGYRVLAPDLRGYGETENPYVSSCFTIFHIVADLLGLLDHFNLEQVVVVGHDWGANAAWHLCLLRPERVKGIVALGVPFFPRSPGTKPAESSFTKSFGNCVYISGFQEPKRAEQAFLRYDYLSVIKNFLCINQGNLQFSPPGIEIMYFLRLPHPLPSWITEEELQAHADAFRRSGFTGALNYYRAMDEMTPELLAPWKGVKIKVPSKLIVGYKDVGFDSWRMEYFEVDVMRELAPDVEVVIIDGHRFIHQEKPQEVSDHILSFLQKHA